MALQAQGADLTERIFAELCSKHGDVRSRAANELKDLVTVYSRGMEVAAEPYEFRLMHV